MNGTQREDTMFKQEFLTRQAEIIPDKVHSTQITVIGAGAVGSFTVLSLAKMGFNNITVYDFDKIDEENMNCQFYRHTDIGRPKVEALQELVYAFTGQKITVHNKRITKADEMFTNIVISAVDSMEVRKLIAETIHYKHLIDPRMGAEYAVMFAIGEDLNQRANYIKHMYTDTDAVHERCTAKATMYTVNLLAGQICKAVKDITTGSAYIKNFDWNIKNNTLTSFRNDGAML